MKKGLPLFQLLAAMALAGTLTAYGSAQFANHRQRSFDAATVVAIRGAIPVIEAYLRENKSHLKQFSCQILSENRGNTCSPIFKNLITLEGEIGLDIMVSKPVSGSGRLPVYEISACNSRTTPSKIMNSLKHARVFEGKTFRYLSQGSGKITSSSAEPEPSYLPQWQEKTSPCL